MGRQLNFIEKNIKLLTSIMLDKRILELYNSTMYCIN